ncbi:MAG TPA: hypothetical protein VIV40_08475 [Kofleriaceae bacterium]
MSTAVERPKEPSTRGRALAKASVNPVNLGIAAGAATLAIGLGSLPIGLLGGLAYLALVAFDALSPKKKALRPRIVASTLPDPKTIKDADTRAAVEKIVASKAALDRAIEDTPPDVVAHMTTTLATLEQLEAHGARLVARNEDIVAHLSDVNVGQLVEEIKQLQQRAQDASHPDSRQSLDQARLARMEELRALKELRATKDSIDAQLLRLVAVFGALPTKLVYMRALDAQAVDRLSGDMNEELEAVSSELKTSEKVIKNLEVE